jgi:dCMP deaminase
VLDKRCYIPHNDWYPETENKRVKWDLRYLQLAKHVSRWSKDPSTKVGAVVVNWEQHLEFVGYNGFPRGIADTDERLNDRETKYRLVVHAEVNAIVKAGAAARGATLYVYPGFLNPPICNECAKIAIQAGIKEIVGFSVDSDEERSKRWAASSDSARTLVTEAGITWYNV